MLIIPIALHSAVNGAVSVQASLKIVNDGTGNKTRGNYRWTLYGRNNQVLKQGRIGHWPRTQSGAAQLLARVMIAAYPGIDKKGVELAPDKTRS